MHVIICGGFGCQKTLPEEERWIAASRQDLTLLSLKSRNRLDVKSVEPIPLSLPHVSAAFADTILPTYVILQLRLLAYRYHLRHFRCLTAIRHLVLKLSRLYSLRHTIWITTSSRRCSPPQVSPQPLDCPLAMFFLDRTGLFAFSIGHPCTA